jgi:hypothetical protein
MNKAALIAATLLLIVVGFYSLAIGQASTSPVVSKGFLIDSNPQGATVFIENEVIGKTPCRFSFDLSGTYRLWANKKGYENWNYQINFSEKSVRTIFFYLTPKISRYALWRSMVLPGWGQQYSERKIKSNVIIGVQLASLASLVVSEYVYRNRYDEYKSELNNYQITSRNFATEAQAWQKLQKSHDDLHNARQTRYVCAAATAAIYLYNVLDSYVNFPRNLRQIEIAPLSGSGTDVSAHVSGIQLCWSF